MADTALTETPLKASIRSTADAAKISLQEPQRRSTERWEILLLLILGMIPLLWFRPGEIATGGDVVFPLDPIGWFKYRTFMWDYRVDAGGPSAVHATTLPFHAVQVVLALLGFPLGWVQRLSYVFWNTAVCASIYGLLRTVLPARVGKTGLWIGVALYAFNPFLFNTWEAAKTSILSAFVLFPFTLMILAGVLRRGWSVPVSMAGFALATILTGSIGADPPVLAVLMFLVVAALCAWGVERHPKGSGIHLPGRVWGIFFLLVATYALASSFWIAPYYGWELWLKFTSHAASGSTALETVFHLGDWLKDISTHTSFFNVIRLQAAWDWYYTWNSEPYISYAARYFSNPLIVLLSMVWPLLAVGGIYQAKDRTSWLFALLAVVGIVGAMGAHAPTKPFFLWMADHFPGFFVFRSPYYKFGILIPLAYAFLVPIGWSTLLGNLQTNFPARLQWKKWTAGFLFVSNALYAAPLLMGEIIYTHQKLASIRLKIPGYVGEAYQWFRKAPSGRVLSLPQDVADMYRWGYGSLAHLLIMGVDRTVLKGISDVTDVDRLRNFSYQTLYTQATPYAKNLLSLLGVRYLLVRGDAWYDFYGDTDSPEFVQERIEKQEQIAQAASIGPWKIYEVATPEPPLKIASGLTTMVGPTSGLIPWTYPRASQSSSALFYVNDEFQKTFLRDWINQQESSELILHDTTTLDLVVDTMPSGDWISFDKSKVGWIWKSERAGLYEIWVQWPSDQPLTFSGIGAENNGLILPSREQKIQGFSAGRWVRMNPRVFTTGEHTFLPLDPASLDELPPMMIFPAEQLDNWLSAVKGYIDQNTAPVHLLGRGVVSWDAGNTPAGSQDLEIIPYGILEPASEQSWGWLEPQAGCVLINRTDHPMQTNLQLMVYSPNADRTLYISQDGNLLRHLRVRAGFPLPITFENLTLTPAEHRIEFYVLEGGYTQHQANGESVQVTLGVRSFHVGPSALEVPLDVPRAGKFRLHCYPTPQAIQGSKVGVLLSGRSIPLESHSTESGQFVWWSSQEPLELGPGKHAFLVTGDQPCNYFVELEEILSGPEKNAESAERFQWEQISPTDYRAHATVQAGKPRILVTQDLYDPQWRAEATSREDGRKILLTDHIKVNGYANAWTLPSAGDYDITVSYLPQQIFRGGVWVTAGIALISGFILAAGIVLRARRKK